MKLSSQDWTKAKQWLLNAYSPIHIFNIWESRNIDYAQVKIVKGYFFFDEKLCDFLYNECDSSLVLLYSDKKKTFHLSQWQDIQIQKVLGLVE